MSNQQIGRPRGRGARLEGAAPGADAVALHERDFYAWTLEQASALRSHRPNVVDWKHLAEELESIGGSEQREMEKRLRLIVMQLLKWQVQPAFRSKSWERTLRTQRRDLERHLRRNPSLRRLLPDALLDQYDDAVTEAIRDTGLAESAFPTALPYSVEQVVDQAFLPE
jgi:Domain of unknown function DUF29